jgi:hypothetical protein
MKLWFNTDIMFVKKLNLNIDFTVMGHAFQKKWSSLPLRNTWCRTFLGKPWPCCCVNWIVCMICTQK